MRKLIFTLSTVAFLAAASPASALVIDTSGLWDGVTVNDGWEGSGQSITVDAVENLFESITFYFDAASAGRNFDLVISDALNGGATLFSTPFVANTGATDINVGQAFGAGSLIFVQIDYNGFLGKTAHYLRDVYPGGNSAFGDLGFQQAQPTLDHRFIARFSDDLIVPEPSSLALFGLGLVAVGLGRRHRLKV